MLFPYVLCIPNNTKMKVHIYLVARVCDCACVCCFFIISWENPSTQSSSYGEWRESILVRAKVYCLPQSLRQAIHLHVMHHIRDSLPVCHFFFFAIQSLERSFSFAQVHTRSVERLKIGETKCREHDAASKMTIKCAGCKWQFVCGASSLFGPSKSQIDEEKRKGKHFRNALNRERDHYFLAVYVSMQ